MDNEKRITALATMAAVRTMLDRACKHSDRPGFEAFKVSPTASTSKSIDDISVLDIDLLLKLVLEKVEKDDRLTCRSVNKTWFQLMSAQLKNQQTDDSNNSWTVVVNIENIQEYVEFVKEVDPFMRESLLDVSVVIGGSHRYKQEEYDEVLRGLEDLIELRGRDFVRSIVVNITREDVEPSWLKVFWLIKVLAPGLKELTIEDKTLRPDLSKIERFFRFTLRPGAPPRLFPKLLSLTYNAVLKNAWVLPQIVNAAPNLEKLVVGLKRFEIKRAATYQRRAERIQQALHLIAKRPKSLQKLKELEIPLDETNNYLELCRLRLPKLEKLKLASRRTASYEATQGLASFLKNCPTLKHLEFDWHTYQRDYNATGYDFPHGDGFPQFPKDLPELPQVTHLGWGAEQTEVIIRVSRAAAIRMDNLNRWSFPNLTTITLKAGTFLYFGAGFPQDPDTGNIDWRDNSALINHINFPTVTRLNFIIDILRSRARAGFGPLSIMKLPEICNQIHMLFPNLKEVFIDNQVTPLETNVRKLKILLKTFLEEVVGFETLEISNYFQDWLNDLMDEFPRVVTNLQNLKTLIIPRVTKHFEDLLISAGASIGLRQPEEYRSSFEERVMEQAALQFPPDELHPWENALEDLLIGGVQAPLHIIQVFLVGQSADLDFELVEPVILELGLVPGILAMAVNAGELLDENEDPDADVEILVEGENIAGNPGIQVNAGAGNPGIQVNAGAGVPGINLMLQPAEVAEDLAAINLGDLPVPPLVVPTLNQVVLRELRSALRDYPLPKIVAYTRPKVNVPKLVGSLPGLEYLHVNDSFLADSIGNLHIEDRVKILNCAYPRLIIKLI